MRNKERTTFDGETESELKERSRLFGPIVMDGWLFEDGDIHPWPENTETEGGDSA